MAFSNAFVPVGFGGPLNPTCASLSCTIVNGVSSSPFCLRNHFRIVAAGPPPAIAGATETRAPTPSDIPETFRNLRRSNGLSICTSQGVQWKNWEVADSIHPSQKRDVGDPDREVI